MWDVVEENAEAPLSQVYDNRSALEQLHSYLLLRTMRHHGLGALLDDPQRGMCVISLLSNFFFVSYSCSLFLGTLFRKILKSSVLATDMGVHQTFMKNFEEILDGTDEASNGMVRWQSTKCERQAFICQLLLKNADISNPVSLSLSRSCSSPLTFIHILFSVDHSSFRNNGHPRFNKNGRVNINSRIFYS